MLRSSTAGVPINTNPVCELASATNNENPAFLLVPGDWVESRRRASFPGWNNVMAPVYRAGIGVYPVMGNHDSGDVATWKSVFGAQIPDNGPGTELERAVFPAYSNALMLAFDNYASETQWSAADPVVDV